jgi:glucose-6-phosphate 1-dehydrogenase
VSRERPGGGETPVLVVFGATGNLASGKIVPALFSLFRKNRLPPGLRVVGSARHDLDDAAFRARLERAARETAGPSEAGPFDAAAWKEFAPSILYAPGDTSSAAGLARVAARLDGLGPGGRVFYLALAPALYAPAVRSLREAGLAGRAAAGCRRLVVEKPFGRDLGSARELNHAILDVFDEPQVFRIDHYLGKETVQNLLVLRFANLIFEPIWSRQFIDHVQITVAESGLVGARGAYYDAAGVLRDMFQNHLMQLLCLVAMEAPSRFEADAVRTEKVKLLDAVRRLAPADCGRALVTGQYEGYRREPGVAPASRTATYAALRLFVDNWRWQGVPFYLRSGKGLAEHVTEIVVQFHRPPHVMFDLPAGRALDPNRIVINIQPDEGVRILFQSKRPERGMEVRTSALRFRFGEDGGAPIPSAYERLLLDVLAGEATLFMRHDEIERAWSIVDPLVQHLESPGSAPPETYHAGTWGPPAAGDLPGRDGRAWGAGSASNGLPEGTGA